MKRFHQAVGIILNLIPFFSPCLCASSEAAGKSPSDSAGSVTALAFNPDGKRLAVGTYRQVHLYDTSSWQRTEGFPGLQDAPRSLSFRPDGSEIAIGEGLPGESGRVVIWSPGSTKARSLTGFRDSVESVAWKPDGSSILAGGDDDKARLYPNTTSPVCTTLEEHNGRVQAVGFSPKNDSIFVTGATDRVVKVWDAKTMRTVINFDQSEGGITGLAFLPDGYKVVGASLDGRLRWWQINRDAKKSAWSGSLYRNRDAHPGGVLALSFSADGKRLISGGMDGLVAVWDAANGNKLREFKDSAVPIYAVAISPDGKIAAGAGRQGSVWIWDVEANKLLNTLSPPPLPLPLEIKPASKSPAKSLRTRKQR